MVQRIWWRRGIFFVQIDAGQLLSDKVQLSGTALGTALLRQILIEGARICAGFDGLLHPMPVRETKKLSRDGLAFGEFVFREDSAQGLSDALGALDNGRHDASDGF
jgi:hypothetical protein